MKTKQNLENIKKIYHYTYVLISFYSGLHMLSDISVRYTYKDELEATPDVLSTMRSFEKIPFIIQPFMGYFIDVYSIFGFRRRIYIFIAAFSNAFCLLYISFTDNTILSLGIFVFLIKFGVSLCLTVAEALTVELKNIEEYEKFEKAQDIVSNYFLFKFIGEFFTSFLKWYLIEIISFQSIFLISSILPIILVFSGIIFDEKKIENQILLISNDNNSEELKNLIDNQTTHDKTVSNNLPFQDKNRRSFILDTISSHSEIDHLKNPPHTNDILFKIKHVFTSKNYLIPMIFFLFYKTSPPIDEPKFFYYTNFLFMSPKQLGYVEILSSFMSISAVLSYKFYLKQYSTKAIFTWSIILNFLMGGLYVLLFLRINIKLGIPDIVIIFISDSFNSFIMKLLIMPIISVGCALSPKDIEGTVVTCFYASMNMGSFIGDLLTSLISKFFNLENSNFNNFHWVILVCKLYSLLPILFIFIVNPDYFKPNDDFINEENKTESSLKNDARMTFCNTD